MKISTKHLSEDLFNSAGKLREKNQVAEAVVMYLRILEQNPHHTPSLQELALICLTQNKQEEFAQYYNRLLNLQPQDIQWQLSLAQVFFERKNFHQAREHLQIALTLKPQSVLANSNLGYIHYLLGNYIQAERFCRKAMSLQPDFVDAHCNLGIIFLAQGKSLQAREIFLKAIKIAPDAPLAWSNLAITFMNEGQLTDSIQASRRALYLEPNMVEAYCNLGMALQESMQLQEAIQCYEKALRIEPHHSVAQSNRLMCMQYIPHLGSKILRETAATFSLDLPPVRVSSRLTKRNQKLRIGYVSGDFRSHPVGWFLLALFSFHDKAKVDIYCYETANRQDAVTSSLRTKADHWCSIHNLTDSQAVEKIIADEIDVLVDLAGHTAGNRLGVFALKPAAVQVSWLGYFASTGLDNMDYVFIDAAQAPLGNEVFFHEKLYRLHACQFCFTPPEYSPPVSKAPHLRNNYLTFGSFNNTAKLNHEVLALWSRLLQQIPDSRLILKWKSFRDQHLSNQIRQYFKDAGIPEDRIELRGASDHKTMLSEYGDIDLALDPFPFSGALTTCEALWMGVPVVTLAQFRPVSRQSAAILLNIGLTDLITYTPDEYVKKVIELAMNKQKLTQLRFSLRDKMSASAQSSGILLARQLEKAFKTVHRKAFE